jgi:hypothetical protein
MRRKYKRFEIRGLDLGIQWNILPTVLFVDHYNALEIGICFLRWEVYLWIELAEYADLCGMNCDRAAREGCLECPRFPVVTLEDLAILETDKNIKRL